MASVVVLGSGLRYRVPHRLVVRRVAILMSNQNRYEHGGHNKICNICGQKYKASDMEKMWNNTLVCKHDYEDRQPQDTIRSRADRQRVDACRPESTSRTTYWDGSSMVDGDNDPSEDEFL